MNKGKKLVLWIGLGCCSLCCLGLMIPLWTMLHGKHDLGKALVAYRAKGLPWTASEVDQNPPAKPGENAAPILKQVFTLIQKNGSTDAGKVGDLILANDDRGAWAVINQYSAALKLAHQAAQLPRAEFPKDWDLGPEVLFPELANVKTIVKLLSDKAVLEARRGDVSASNIDLQDAWAVGKLVGRQPILIGLLVQVACRAITMAAIERAITAYVMQPEALRRLKTTLDKFSDDPAFAPTVRGEAYMGLAILRNAAMFRPRLSSGGSDSGAPPPPLDTRKLKRSGNPSGFLERLLGGKLIESYLRLDDIAKKDAGNWRQLDADLKALDVEYASDQGISSFYRNLLMPVYANCGEALLKDQTRRITLEALLVGVLKHAQTGTYPHSVEELPGKWIDPFTGDPLRISVAPDSFRVYSVGPNRKDDGGKAQIELRGSPDYDLVSACPPVTKPVKATKKPPTPKPVQAKK